MPEVKRWKLAMKSQLFRWPSDDSANPEWRDSGTFVDENDYIEAVDVNERLCEQIKALEGRLRAPATPRGDGGGVSVICGNCGTLVSGTEAGDKVKWVRCQSCTPPAATDGFVRVPKEPTEEMETAGNAARYGASTHRDARLIYKAMLAAAPQSELTR